MIQVHKEFRYSTIEEFISLLNEKVKKERIEELFAQSFLNKEEQEEVLDGESLESYFENELDSTELYELKEIGEELTIGMTFLTIVAPDGDCTASFVLTGHAGEGVFSCSYINNDLDLETDKLIIELKDTINELYDAIENEKNPNAVKEIEQRIIEIQALINQSKRNK